VTDRPGPHGNGDTTPAAPHPEPDGYAAARTRLLDEERGPGPQRRRRLAELTDTWLAGLLTEATGATAPDPAPADPPGPVAPAAPGPAIPGIALVAVGGYGRAELSPRSDLDLLLLHDGSRKSDHIARIADALWYPVWDTGLALDHSVRTPGEARRTAAEDLKVQLGLLDARHIAGDPALTAALRTDVLADWRAGAPTRLPELQEMCQARAERHGELSFLLEPDLKEAHGGLRDATALRAVAASWLADAPREGLDHARTVLLDTRDALHLVTGRATDRLALQEQQQVATALGLLDADALLRKVYEAARTVRYASDVTWREVGRVLRARQGRARRARRGLLGIGRGHAPDSVERTPLTDGVVEHEGEAVLARTARPDRDPVLPLRAAAAAAQAGLPLSRHAVRRLAITARPLPVPWPEEAREQFITLLDAGESAIPVWEALEAEDLITRFLPDWERVRCRPQRNPVHRWTVDRHLVETAVRASAFTRDVSRPDLLLMAALLHDIGKGWPGDHSTRGEIIARDVAVRLGFPPADTDLLALLVRHHLLLVNTATRRDLDDPATLQAVAGAVRTPEALELLHALTRADALATGPAAWSTWRAGLVADLVTRVAAVLAGEPVPRAAEPATTAEQERLAVEAARTGGPVLALRAHPHPGTAAHGEDVRGGDVRGEGVRGEGVRGEGVHGEGVHGEEPEPVGIEVHLAVPDRPGLLAAAAGVLALNRLSVRSADLRRLDPVGEGPITLLSWRVGAEYGAVPEAARLRQDLARVLDGSLHIPRRLAQREAAYPRRRGRPAPPPRVTVAPGTSTTATVLEIRAQDAPGLLHRIGRALEATGVTVRSARISTLGANAVDAFYVTDLAGAPLSPERAREVAGEVEKALR
jgi:[protein-PII] uridylyltransferase